MQGRQLRQWIECGNRRFKATVRRTHSGDGAKRGRVFVLPGRLILPSLPKEHSDAVREFSKEIGELKSRRDLNALEAYKAFLDKHGVERNARFGAMRAVPWDLGPTPVLEIGQTGSVPVCVTPLAFTPRSKSEAVQQSLPLDQGRVLYLDILQQFLSECLEDYFAEIADHLWSACTFADKKHALETVRKVRRRLSLSVKPKLNEVRYDKKASTIVRDLQISINREFESEIPFYDAAVEIIELCSTLLAWIAGGDFDVDAAAERARRAIAKVDSHDPDIGALAQCLDFLSSVPDRDSLSPLSSNLSVSREWLSDLLRCSEFLHFVRGLIIYYKRDATHVFVTHHMDVYASEEFFEQLRELAKKKWGDFVVVWTGYGRQSDIELAILARLWLSHVQVLYIPNSLDTRRGGAKQLRHESDWVVEELAYGALIGKPLHVVVAINSEQCRQQIEEQLREYRWGSLPESLGGGEQLPAIGKIPKQLQQHLKNRIYTQHQPSRGTMEHADDFSKGIFVPAMKAAFRQALWTLRLGFEADDWLIVQALCRASTRQSGLELPKYVTAEEIAEEALDHRRKDNRTISSTWITRRLRERILMRSVLIRGTRIPVVLEGPRRGSSKTYSFSLGAAVGCYAQDCGSLLTATELKRVFLQVLTHPVRSKP